jgi:hypothetical protein
MDPLSFAPSSVKESGIKKDTTPKVCLKKYKKKKCLVKI